MSYLNHGYNDSPVITVEANAALTAPAMKAFALNASGKAILPANAGDFCIGIALASSDDVAAGANVDLQIKDGCYAIVGETVKRGDLLAGYTDGTLKKATAGQHVIAVALNDAASGKPCQVFITRTVIAPSASTLSLKLDDLTDVDLTTPPTDTQVLKYDNASQKWKAGNDAT